MQRLKNIRWMPVLMLLTILAIAAFQFYWLQKAYDREKRTLEMRTNILFRETVRDVQAAKLKLDRLGDSTHSSQIIYREFKNHHRNNPDQNMAGMVDVVMQRVKDSGKKMMIITGNEQKDTQYVYHKAFSSRRNRLMQFLSDIDSVQDSVKVVELTSAYSKRLNEQNLTVPFSILRVPTVERDTPVFNEVTLGFVKPVTFRLTLTHLSPLLLRRIGVPILFSVFLIAFTCLSFFLLYKNLTKERRLANIKNEFISNITHELKTPIATVSVAIEALKNYNASMDPEKSREYLDISANELQRLSLLVDKVLKLSMFEKKEIELKYEVLDMKELIEEVSSSMRLQFEKRHAKVHVTTEGDTTLEADRLHLVSVLFNLLDNALKYSSENPEINILVKGTDSKVYVMIEDSGIGIPAEYQSKIFEKFFRVPTGNVHNAKGYGLGLSYVAHVIGRHKGNIKVESVEGNGSKFTFNIPRQC